MSLYDLGSNLLDLLEVIHGAGYVYNDISPNKVVFPFNKSFKPNLKIDKSKSIFENKTMHIVDFSFATPYMDFKSQKHLKKK